MTPNKPSENARFAQAVKEGLAEGLRRGGHEVSVPEKIGTIRLCAVLGPSGQTLVEFNYKTEGVEARVAGSPTTQEKVAVFPWESPEMFQMLARFLRPFGITLVVDED